MEINRILVPVDLSEPSFGALGAALPLAELTGARIALLTVNLPIIEDPAAPPAFPDSETTLRRLQERFSEWCRCHPHFPHLERQVKFIVRAGAVVDEILKALAEERADIIVMATHCRKGLSRMVIGSVTETVIRRAECPVLAVPPRAWEVIPEKKEARHERH